MLRSHFLAAIPGELLSLFWANSRTKMDQLRAPPRQAAILRVVQVAAGGSLARGELQTSYCAPLVSSDGAFSAFVGGTVRIQTSALLAPIRRLSWATRHRRRHTPQPTVSVRLLPRRRWGSTGSRWRPSTVSRAASLSPVLVNICPGPGACCPGRFESMRVLGLLNFALTRYVT